MPAAVTEKDAVCPAVTSALTGCVVIDGATPAALSVSVAALLVALPALFVTTTINSEPLSELVVAGVVYVEEVAPLTAFPFFRHW